MSTSRAGRRSVAFGATFMAVVFLAVLPAQAIIFGTVDTAHSYVGSLIVEGSRFGVFCSGSLVSPRVFLTAGHCTVLLKEFGFPLNTVFVSFATNVLQDKSTWRPIVGFMTNPDIQINAINLAKNDYGVIILASAVTDVSTASLAPVGYLDGLASAGVLKGAEFSAVGYGMTENSQIDGFRRIATSEFSSLQDPWLFLSENGNKGNAGACLGDSGSPALYDTGSGELVVATFSWFPGLSCGVLAIYNRVDTPDAVNFIQGAIAANP